MRGKAYSVSALMLLLILTSCDRSEIKGNDEKVKGTTVDALKKDLKRLAGAKFQDLEKALLPAFKVDPAPFLKVAKSGDGTECYVLSALLTGMHDASVLPIMLALLERDVITKNEFGWFFPAACVADFFFYLRTTVCKEEQGGIPGWRIVGGNTSFGLSLRILSQERATKEKLEEVIAMHKDSLSKFRALCRDWVKIDRIEDYRYDAGRWRSSGFFYHKDEDIRIPKNAKDMFPESKLQISDDSKPK